MPNSFMELIVSLTAGTYAMRLLTLSISAISLFGIGFGWVDIRIIC